MQREDVELPRAGSLNPPAFAEDSRHFIRHHLNRVQTVDMASCEASLRTMRNFHSSSKADIAPANRDAVTDGESEPLLCEEPEIGSCRFTRSEWEHLFCRAAISPHGRSWHAGPSTPSLRGTQVVDSRDKASRHCQLCAKTRGTPEVRFGGPTRTRTWNQRIMSPLL